MLYEAFDRPAADPVGFVATSGTPMPRGSTLLSGRRRQHEGSVASYLVRGRALVATGGAKGDQATETHHLSG